LNSAMLAFAKGHGTLNDFVCFSDPDGVLDLTDEQIRFLCDRRAGIGGDGTLRAVRARHVPGYQQHGDTWFMDYRNADASIAEMCGNGLRVFLRYLLTEGLIDDRPIDIVTRAGVRHGEFLDGDQIRIGMGVPRVAPDQVPVTVGEQIFQGRAVDVGNPHAAVLLSSGGLDTLDLTREPGYPAEVFPHRANVEFVEPVGDHHGHVDVAATRPVPVQGQGTAGVHTDHVLAENVAAAPRDRGQVLVDLRHVTHGALRRRAVLT